MVVISKAILREFMVKYPDSLTALEKWFSMVKKANWANFSQMQQSFNSVDAIGGDRYVFDVRGNRYRIIALVIFRVRTVFILFVGTHAQYDRVDAATITYK
jgi:mRNA interferase HigB